MNRCAVLASMFIATTPALAADFTVMTRRSELIVVGRASTACTAVKIIPAKTWYKKLPDSKQLLLGAVRIHVSKTLKGVLPEGPLLAVFGTKIFVDNTKERQTSTMDDFVSFPQEILGMPLIWFLEWDETAKSYAIKKKEVMWPMNMQGAIEQAVLADAGSAPVPSLTPRKGGWGKLRPDVIEGSVQSVDTDKGVLTVDVPKTGLTDMEGLEGAWTLVLPQWCYGEGAKDTGLTAAVLRKGDTVQAVTRPGEGEDTRERKVILIDFVSGKPLASLCKLMNPEAAKPELTPPPVPRTPEPVTEE